jgi:hypothetical protein
MQDTAVRPPGRPDAEGVTGDQIAESAFRLDPDTMEPTRTVTLHTGEVFDGEAGAKLFQIHHEWLRKTHERPAASHTTAPRRTPSRNHARAARCSAGRTTGSRRTTAAASSSSDDGPSRRSNPDDDPAHQLGGNHSRFPTDGSAT